MLALLYNLQLSLAMPNCKIFYRYLAPITLSISHGYCLFCTLETHAKVPEDRHDEL